jgi:hypothetical protein
MQNLLEFGSPENNEHDNSVTQPLAPARSKKGLGGVIFRALALKFQGFVNTSAPRQVVAP